MTDPFTDVDAAAAPLIDIMVTALEARAADPSMIPVVQAYLDLMHVPAGGLVVDIGSGTGGVTRRIADHFPEAPVIGIEPSVALTDHARRLSGDRSNLTFHVGDGGQLAVADGAADVSILHTVLSHVPDPAQLISEATRILRPCGTLVICDADFSKAAMGIVADDPLGSCAEAFVDGSVTDRWLTGKLKPMVSRAGLTTTHFSVVNRLVTAGMGGMVWVRMSGARLVADGVIGQPLADALEAEYLRRADAESLYCFLPFVTLIATKPAA